MGSWWRYLILMSWVGLSVGFAMDGKKVFETYCWGCHHQTATAFGPSFSQIASRRTAEEIKAMITDPKRVSKQWGYRRNAMPALHLSTKELEAITAYILSFKPQSSADTNTTTHNNTQVPKGSYRSSVAKKEL